MQRSPKESLEIPGEIFHRPDVLPVTQSTTSKHWTNTFIQS